MAGNIPICFQYSSPSWCNTPAAFQYNSSMNWEKKIDQTTHYIHIDHVHVIFGSTLGSGHTDNAASISHAEFMEGRFHAEIRELFGENVLSEVLAAVQNADTDPLFSAQNNAERTLLETLNAIPLDARLAGLVGNPAVENGGLNYDNAGGYKTTLRSDTLTLTFKRDQGTLTPNTGGAPIDVTLPGHGSAAVALHDHFYIVVSDELVIITPTGTVIQPQPNIFGETLRIGYVYRHKDVVFVSYRWFYGNHAKGWLQVELGEGFTGRWVELKD